MRTSWRRTVGAVMAALVLLLVAGAVPALAYDHNAQETALLRLINRTRAAHGLHVLSERGALSTAALGHSRDMVRRDYFSHDSLSGLTVGSRVRRAGYTQSGCSAWSVGECIAWGSGTLGSPKAILRAWMHSKPHRAILLGKRWRDVGLGCAHGAYCGVSGASMFTVDVGRRVQ